MFEFVIFGTNFCTLATIFIYSMIFKKSVALVIVALGEGMFNLMNPRTHQGI